MSVLPPLCLCVCAPPGDSLVVSIRNLPVRCVPWQVEFRKTAEAVAAEPWALTAAAEYLQEWVQRNVDARWGAPPTLHFVAAGPRDFAREGSEFSAWQDFAPTAARPVYVVRSKRPRKGPQAHEVPAGQEAEPEVPHGLPGVAGGLAEQAAGAGAGGLYLGQNLESLLGILSQKPADRPDEFKGLKVGCSKCRRSERGCAQCRGLLARELLGQSVRRRRAAHQPREAAAAPVPVAGAAVRRRPAAAPGCAVAAPGPGAESEAPGPEAAAPSAAGGLAPPAAEADAAPHCGAVFHGDRGQQIFAED